MRITRWWLVALLAGPVGFMAAFFVVPLGVVAIDSVRDPKLGWTLAHYVRSLSDLYYWETLLKTFKISLWITLASLLLGYPLAYYITYVVKSRAVRRAIYIVVVTPLFTSNIVRAFAWIVLLGRRGLVNAGLIEAGIIDRPLMLLFNEESIVIGMTYIMTPFAVLTIASVLQNIDRSLEDAARDLGASRAVAFLKVTLPLSLPGVVAGSLIVFTLSVSAYVTPAILSGGKLNVMPMLIFQQYGAALNIQFGAVLSITLLVTSLILVVGYLFAVERRSAGGTA